MIEDMIEPIAVGLKRALREALRTCKGYKVCSTERMLGSERALVLIRSPTGRIIQNIYITGSEVISQWPDLKASPSRVIALANFLQVQYEYADPGFIAQLRRDTRDAAKMHQYHYGK